MRVFDTSIVQTLRRELAVMQPREVLPRELGGGSVAGGLWRFFSQEDVTVWNSSESWRGAWPGLSAELFFFGEDLWGNQLTLKPRSENVWLWNHENGEMVDLMLDPATLLETVMQSGIDWIDFYTPQMLAVGRSRLLDVPEKCHLHWTQPLIMGGSVATANTSVVSSATHLKGHGALWAQLSGLPTGAEIIIKPKQ